MAIQKDVFMELGKALAEKNSLDTEIELHDIKREQQAVNSQYEMEKKRVEAKKALQDEARAKLKFGDKLSKIQQDILKQAVSTAAQGPVAVGANLLQKFVPEQEPGTEGLPMLDIGNRAV